MTSWAERSFRIVRTSEGNWMKPLPAGTFVAVQLEPVTL
jgi:hypothetical protein